mmetsp:Transcript_44399/g.141346  ORF Transcript_44399/g.141346 Transcript_44399/m.141346 type:complete len:125 (+) Transcript_44399:402-776(+)
MFMAGANKVTDAISPEMHAQLALQLDVMAKAPWGFLGLSGETFRLAIGYTEVVCAICCILPGKLRLVALHLITIILVAAAGSHVYHKDGMWQPAAVLGGLAVGQLVQLKRAKKAALGIGKKKAN